MLDQVHDPGSYVPGGLPADLAGHDGVLLLCEQLDALQRWHDHRRGHPDFVETPGMNRELRLDLVRREMVRDRQHQALLARLADRFAAGERLQRRTPVRAVIAHRHAWVRGKIAIELGRQGVQVLAELDDGADAVGVSVAEQPDLLLVEQALPTMTGVEVLQAVRAFSPRTRLAAQGEGGQQLAALVAAGAAAAFTRRSTPTEMARDLLQLVRP